MFPEIENDWEWSIIVDLSWDSLSRPERRLRNPIKKRERESWSWSFPHIINKPLVVYCKKHVWKYCDSDNNFEMRTKIFPIVFTPFKFSWPLVAESLVHLCAPFLFRLEVCRDRQYGWIFPSCVNFPKKQCASFLNLHRNMKFTHWFGKFTHTFFTITIEVLHIDFNFNKKRPKLVLSLAKIVAIYALLVCTIFGPKIGSCKFHVCFCYLQ